MDARRCNGAKHHCPTTERHRTIRAKRQTRRRKEISNGIRRGLQLWSPHFKQLIDKQTGLQKTLLYDMSRISLEKRNDGESVNSGFAVLMVKLSCTIGLNELLVCLDGMRRLYFPREE
jgi:hypothetical protein